MIDHSNCDHERSSSARARCRRGKQEPWPRPPLYSLGPPPKQGASVKDEWMGKAHHNPDRERNRGTTPRDRDKQCMGCGVERIQFCGTDPHTGTLLYVGERCTYKVEHMPDFKAVPK